MPAGRVQAEQRVLQALVAALLRGDGGFCVEVFLRLSATMFSTPEYSAAFKTLCELQENVRASPSPSPLAVDILREQFLTRMTRKGFPDVSFEDYLPSEPPHSATANGTIPPLDRNT
jgi:hypothetical protein